jgi:hypothetical protein
VAGINSHRMLTESNYKGILLADKHGRTAEVHSIYKHFVNHVPSKIKPMMAKNNSEEILFDNPNEDERIDKPGFNSGFKSETANDANAGRSGTRKWAHLTEHAFYRFAEEIDEGIQNSIPLARGTYVVKESTAWGVSGNGEAFYNLWCAAESGQSIYKAYFVSWYEIPDYSVNVPIGFILNKDEIELLKICPEIKNENLAWRRLKLSEYSMGKESVFTPEERFCQDFPSWPEQAFLSTGRPVFDRDKLNIQIKSLRDNPVQEIKPKYTKTYLSMYQDSLKVYEPPIKEKKYIIGADIAEGIETGDFSTAFVMDTDHKQVASFHCHIDPDHFGKLLVELAIIYNGALLVPEINSMGHTTLTAIKSMDYLKVYMRSIDDEVIDEETSKMGWRTTRSSKQTMISKLVARFRDNEIKIRDVNLLKDMLGLARESDGNVELTGIDRVVAACLACVGIDQIYEAATVTNPNKKQKILYETKDLYREKLHGKSK